MARKRMFSPDITCSDAFVDMPLSAQALYFHICMRADDDGFVGSAKQIMRVVGSNEDDLKILIAKRFVLIFESGAVVVKHWLIHNLIRSDLYKETMYISEKKTLGLSDIGAYTELRPGVKKLKKVETPAWLKKRQGEETTEVRTVNVPSTSRSRTDSGTLGKVREGKVIKPTAYVNSAEPSSRETNRKALFYQLVKTLGFTDQVKATDGRIRKLGVRLKTYKPSELMKAAKAIESDKFMQGDNKESKRYGTIDYLLRSDETVDKWLTGQAQPAKEMWY
ncbi:MAG: hypothetical protein ACREHG_06615 [Candidatus Saccharimonadales bacterium]